MMNLLASEVARVAEVVLKSQRRETSLIQKVNRCPLQTISARVSANGASVRQLCGRTASCTPDATDRSRRPSGKAAHCNGLQLII
jgi:hypothetical protein